MDDLLKALLAADKKPEKAEKDVLIKRLGVNVRIKVLTQEEIEQVNERATFGKEVDRKKQTALLIKAGTLFDWGAKELLEHYGASDDLGVIEKALLAGEKVKLVTEIMELSGFDKSLGEEIEAAKN